MQKHFNTLINDGKKVVTAKNICKYFYTFFSDCVKDGLIVRNPCSNIKFPKSYSVNEEDVFNNKFIFLDDDQQRQFISAIKGDNMELIILPGLCCGMRLGEILALNYSDFDFDNCWININKSLKKVPFIEEDGSKIYKYVITKSKTDSSIRKCPLPRFLIPKIKALNELNLKNKLEYSDVYCDINLLFCNNDGTPVDPKKPNRRVRSFCKKLNYSDKIHFHSLRSIFISNCANKDIDLKTIMAWVGHSDYRTTMNIYVRINKSKLQQSSALVNSIFEDIV